MRRCCTDPQNANPPMTRTVRTGGRGGGAFVDVISAVMTTRLALRCLYVSVAGRMRRYRFFRYGLVAEVPTTRHETTSGLRALAEHLLRDSRRTHLRQRRKHLPRQGESIRRQRRGEWERRGREGNGRQSRWEREREIRCLQHTYTHTHTHTHTHCERHAKKRHY